MDDTRQTIAGLRNLIKALQQHPPDSVTGRALASQLPNAENALAWLGQQERRETTPVIFSLEVPGFAWMGLEGDCRPVPLPDQMDGIQAAWEIFLAGENAPLVMFAAQWGWTPNALRNALKRAAGWAGRHCRQLEVAINAIEVARDGSARFAPAYPTTIKLYVF